MSESTLSESLVEESPITENPVDHLSESPLEEQIPLEDQDHAQAQSYLVSAVTEQTIAALAPKVPISLEASTPVADAIRLMQEKRIGAIVVVEDGHLAGIFTERDVLFKITDKGVDTRTTVLRELMTSNPESLTADDRILYALNRMTIGGYRHIPIVTADDQLSGIISVKDIVEFLVGVVETAVFESSF